MQNKEEIRLLSVVGVTFEGRQEILSDFYNNIYKEGSKNPVELFLEDDNPYDSNAIKVSLEVGGKFNDIGYISKDDNVELRKVFKNIKKSYIQSMGANYKGVLGLTIAVIISYEDEENEDNVEI